MTYIYSRISLMASEISEISEISGIRGCWLPRKHCYLLYGSHIALSKHLRDHFDASGGSKWLLPTSVEATWSPLVDTDGHFETPLRLFRSLCGLKLPPPDPFSGRQLVLQSSFEASAGVPEHFEASFFGQSLFQATASKKRYV